MSYLTNIAVLIDADNASANTIAHVFEKIETLGKIRCKKIYGDWGQTNLSSWQSAILRFAIDPMQQFSYVKGKNATDIALVIEAMDLLHSRDYDGFCLVSSDSDFASLAVRIRKNGLPVYGFGKSSAVASFKQACDKFFVVDELKPKSNPAKTATPTQNNLPKERWTTAQLQKQTHLIQLMKTMLQNNVKAENGWSHISYLASCIDQHEPDLNIKKYGYAKFTDLIVAFRLFDIKKQNNAIFVKFKDNKPTQPSKNSNPIQPPQPTTNLNSQKATSLLLKDNLEIVITSACPADCVLWRLTADKKVRGDEDMIFYGQNFSNDESIELSINQHGDHIESTFNCQLNTQPKEIQRFTFTLTSETDSITHPLPIQVAINQDNNCLFSGQFLVDQTTAKSLLLFELIRTENAWQFFPRKQTIDSDLRQICEKVGIEVSDD